MSSLVTYNVTLLTCIYISFFYVAAIIFLSSLRAISLTNQTGILYSFVPTDTEDLTIITILTYIEYTQ